MFSRKILVGILLAVVSFFTISCEKEDQTVLGTNVEFAYFTARGFNLRFIGILGSTKDIMTQEIKYVFNADIDLNVDNTLIVGSNDIITIANMKKDPNTNASHFNPVFVNCERNPMKFICNEQTVRQDPGQHRYEGTLYFKTENISQHFEFDMREGILTLNLPAQYSVGEGNATLPLSGSEVESIINTGTQGVDYTLFTRNGKTYVRIENNLYERRYDSWVYASIADPMFLTTWMRFQTSLIFQVIDWEDITAPYVVYNADGSYAENRNNVNITGNYEDIVYMSSGIGMIFGNLLNLNEITTPMPCSK